jgi:hypothetical protein
LRSQLAGEAALGLGEADLRAGRGPLPGQPVFVFGADQVADAAHDIQRVADAEGFAADGGDPLAGGLTEKIELGADAGGLLFDLAEGAGDLHHGVVTLRGIGAGHNIDLFLRGHAGTKRLAEDAEQVQIKQPRAIARQQAMPPGDVDAVAESETGGDYVVAEVFFFSASARRI